jgi:hypothetical protein
MNFNHDNIKLKYILGTYKDEPLYPTGEDILYYVIKRHFEKDKGSEITFTDNLLFKKLGSEYLENINNSLEQLLESGYIILSRETNESKSYKVIKNDYINAI